MAAFGIQTLRRGLALCGANFAGFVEAWNHVVRRSANICGDGDANPAEGLVTVDNSDVDHPVIRLDKARLPSGGGGDITIVAGEDTNLVATKADSVITVDVYYS